MKIILRNKKDGRYGTLEHSLLGGAVHTIGENGVLCKGLGERLDRILTLWDMVKLPDGYEVGEHGGVKKKS